MSQASMLKDKKVLIVDDEPDVLDVLEELLDMCVVVKAATYEEAKSQLQSRTFDLAVLDIMGVNGYGLLRIARKMNIPAVMLTAHAFTSDNLVRSVKEGACAYIPKEELARIEEYLVDVLKSKREGANPWATWQQKLPSSYFAKRWGAAWQNADKEFWQRFQANLKSRKDETEKKD